LNGELFTVTAEDCIKFRKLPVSFQFRTIPGWTVLSLDFPGLSPENYVQLVHYSRAAEDIFDKAVSFGYLSGGNERDKENFIPLAKQIMTTMTRPLDITGTPTEGEFIKQKHCTAYRILFFFTVSPGDVERVQLESGDYIMCFSFLFNPYGKNGVMVLGAEMVDKISGDPGKTFKSTEIFKVLNSFRFIKEKK